MTFRSVLLATPMLLIPTLAVAQQAPPAEHPRFEDHTIHIGLGSGWGVPLGNARSGLPLRDVIVGQAPLALDLGFRALPHVFVGAHTGWGFGALEDCPGDERCRGKDVRFGLHGRYLFESRRGLARPAIPWVGLGAGFESLTTRVGRAEQDYQGITYVDLELGLDLPLTARFALGPTVTLSAGEFTQATVEGAESADVEGEIEESRMHGWALFGLRLVLAI